MIHTKPILVLILKIIQPHPGPSYMISGIVCPQTQSCDFERHGIMKKDRGKSEAHYNTNPWSCGVLFQFACIVLLLKPTQHWSVHTHTHTPQRGGVISPALLSSITFNLYILYCDVKNTLDIIRNNEYIRVWSWSSVSSYCNLFLLSFFFGTADQTHDLMTLHLPDRCLCHQAKPLALTCLLLEDFRYAEKIIENKCQNIIEFVCMCGDLTCTLMVRIWTTRKKCNF